MNAKWAAVLFAASTFGALSSQASAQVAGAQTIGVSVEQEAIIINGWSVKKSLLGKPIYNEQGQKVGVLGQRGFVCDSRCASVPRRVAS
jgi:hypothetical protein